MGQNSEQHIYFSEEVARAAIYNDIPCYVDNVGLISRPTIDELFHNETVIPPSFIPYIEKHAFLLDQRNMYADLCNYSAKLIKVSRNHKDFWIEAYGRQFDQLRFIENKLLEIESYHS